MKILSNIWEKWQSTVVGIVIAILEVILAQWNDGHITRQTIAFAVITALLGALSRGFTPSKPNQQG